MTSYRVTNAGEVGDKEGRRRFHGAFTGGFSAGYYNTVGSAEGWTPAPATSSKERLAAAAAAAARTSSSSGGRSAVTLEKRPEDFFDDEDDMLSGQALRLTSLYTHRVPGDGCGSFAATAAARCTDRSMRGHTRPSSSSALLDSFMQRDAASCSADTLRISRSLS